MSMKGFRGTMTLVILLLIVSIPALSEADPRQQVRDRERAFARTMADRDHEAFQSFLSDEAIFFGGQGAIVGKVAVSDAWRPYYEGPTAPFSWEPEIVEVLESRTLAISSGPVLDAEGKNVGSFNSIWRLDADGVWRVVFDKGCGSGS